MKCWIFLFMVGACVCMSVSQVSAQKDWSFDPATLKPFTDGVPYMDKYETCLYPGRTNVIPKAHQDAGVKIAQAIKPLDVEGKVDEKNGRIIALAIGHSNCQMYFGALQGEMRNKKSELHPRFELLNTAVGGNQLPEISRLEGPVWNKARDMLSRPGYSTQQVQVIFFHTTYHGAGNGGRRPPEEFPEHMEKMKGDLAKVLAHCAKVYPNLKIAYLTCDGLRHFTGFEPHVWREAFGFKWLIEDQINGKPGTVFTGDRREIPWVQWGIYFWDNTWDRTYFTDGVHPSDKAREIFVNKYWTFLKADPVAKSWLWNPGS